MNAAHNGTTHYGVNQFSDLTSSEFATVRLNSNISKIVGARLQSIKEKPQKNPSTLINVTDFQYIFTDNNELDKYSKFYKQKLLEKNLNFVPLKVDW